MATRAVHIPVDGASLDADLSLPAGARGIVVFAHGSGSSRHSPRNRQVAGGLQRAGFATLLMDLLTDAQEQIDQRTAELRFDIPLLAARLTRALEWIAGQDELAALPVAIFGASTGAAAALVTAAERPAVVRAVISRGGRPDLAGDRLADVAAPTLLIVGGNDEVVLRINRQAVELLTAHGELAVVPGATHLFDEPGALEAVIALATDWLQRWLAPS
jgi:putative phosphoribosyl transferase